MEANLPEGLTVFQQPEACRRCLRASNMCKSLTTEHDRSQITIMLATEY